MDSVKSQFVLIVAAAFALLAAAQTSSVQDVGTSFAEVDHSLDDSHVSIVYSGAAATVKVADNVARYLTVLISGGHVSIEQRADLPGEVTYTLGGSSDDGSFSMEGKLKATLVLNGLTLHNPDGAAVSILNGKRIRILLAEGTVNSLMDGANGKQKACFIVKGHSEFEGSGTLHIKGNAAHAFWGKEYVLIKKGTGTINVLGAVGDGFHVNQYFQQNDGVVDIRNVGDDGVQVGYKTDNDGYIVADEENTGSLLVRGGSLSIAVTAQGAKGVKAEGPVVIDETKGESNVVITCTGDVDASDQDDLKSSVCMKSEASVTLNGGSVTLTNTGRGGRTLTCDKDIHVNGGQLTAKATGQNYGSLPGGFGPGVRAWGMRGEGASSSSHKYAKSVKAKGNLTVTGGMVTAVSSCHEGIESKGRMEISGGVVNVQAGDDAINSAGDMTVTGGCIYAYSTGNDALDSNGNMYLKGGVIMGFGAGGAEAGIDVAEGRNLFLTGGEIFGIGGRVDGAPNDGGQAYGAASVYATEGYFVLSQGKSQLFAVRIPRSYGGTALVSSPSMKSGSSYTISSAADVDGPEVNGFVASPVMHGAERSVSFTAR